MFETATPIPPADFEMRAHCFNVSYMLSMLSFFITSKKHEDICGWGVPALNNVGVAWSGRVRSNHGRVVSGRVRDGYSDSTSGLRDEGTLL